MKAEEVICLAILPEDVAVGIRYAYKSLSFTFDRMEFGQNKQRRISNIALGKACEATFLRFLRQHGIVHLSREGETHHTRPDHFDIRVMNEIIDLKTFKISEAVARPEKLLKCLALVPHHHDKDQWNKRAKYHRYLFGFFKGQLKLLAIMTKKNEQRNFPKGRQIVPVHNGHVAVLSAPSILFLTAAPTISESESLFTPIEAGTSCVQYPGGTRIHNMGCSVEKLTSFQKFLDKMYQYRRR